MHNNIYTRIVSGIAAAVMTLTNITPLTPMRAEEDYYPEQKKASATDTIAPSTAPVTETFCGPTESTEPTEEVFCGPTECTEETTEPFCGPMQENPIPTEETTVWAEEDLSHQSIELYPNGEETEQIVSLEGLMPEGATAEVVDVSAENNGIAAYDITISDGETEYQPGEEHPILVEITDPVIADVENIELWHIMDDGTREQIFDFTLEDGTVSFYATGFSVYEIVEPMQDLNVAYDVVPVSRESNYGKYTVNPVSGENSFVYTVDRKFYPGIANRLTSLGEFKAHAGDGIYISTNRTSYYMKNTQANNVRNPGRSGITIYKATDTTADQKMQSAYANGAQKYYFEPDESNSLFKIYTFADDGTTKKYVGHNNTSKEYCKRIYLTNDDANNNPQFTDETLWHPNYTGEYFTFYDNTEYYGSTWYLCEAQKNTGTVDGVASFDDATDLGIKFNLWKYEPLPETITSDPYGLSENKEYGLVQYVKASEGYALLAGASGDTTLGSVKMTRTSNSETGVVSYSSNENNRPGCYSISGWSFEWVKETKYKISAIDFDGNVRKYLKLASGSLTLVEDPSLASELTVVPDGNGRIKLIADGMGISRTGNDSNAKFQQVVNTSAVVFDLVDMSSASADELALDGKNYGIVYAQSATAASAVSSTAADATKLQKQNVAIYTNSNTEREYFSSADVTNWTFVNVDSNHYLISTQVEGATKYLKVVNGSVSLSDTPYILTVVPGTGGNAGKIAIINTADNSAMRYNTNFERIGIDFTKAVHFDLVLPASPAPTADPLGLDTKTYGIVVSLSDDTGYAVNPDVSSNKLTGTPMTYEAGKYVTHTALISGWTFHWVEENKYTLSTPSNQYIKLSGNNIQLTNDAPEATPLSVVTDGGKLVFYNPSTLTLLSLNASSFQFTNYNSSNPARFDLVESRDGLKDLYGLDGKAYGLMYYAGNNATTGTGMIAEAKTAAALKSHQLLIRNSTVDLNGKLYVDVDSDIAIWTFISVIEDQYKLKADNNQFLKLTADGLTLTSNEEDASAFTVKRGTGADAQKIKLECNGQHVTLSSGAFKNGAGTWLNFVEKSELTEEDFVIYSATKVGVSDKEMVSYGTTQKEEYVVRNKSEIIIYTRVWNEAEKMYEYYAIDHLGRLHPCYESGDSIMWIGNQINSLLWEFTEYQYPDGTPNGYYELYNPYSRKYLVPMSDGRTLSNSTVGINLRGRRDNEYYSRIMAWDEDDYTYYVFDADVELGKLVTSKDTDLAQKDESADFYFAIMNPTQNHSVQEPLHPVETIDNAQYGITMRMVDWKQEYYNGSKGKTQSVFLGTSFGGANVPPTQGLLSTNLGDDGYPVTTAGPSTRDYISSGYTPGISLKQLFDGADGTYGAQEVNHLFIKSTYEATGYFEFDSCQNTATLIKYQKDADGNIIYDANGMPIICYREDGKPDVDSSFTVFQELSTDENQTSKTHKHGQFFPYDYILPGVTSSVTKNPTNEYDALGNPLPVDYPRRGEPLYLLQYANTTGERPNCFNGTELSAGFVQTPDGHDAWGHDIIFEFTGDDDFWFYVDGELVIDLGGIHSALDGNVNFATGEVTVQNDVNQSIVRQTKSLYEIFKANYLGRNHTAAEALTYMQGQQNNDSLTLADIEADSDLLAAYNAYLATQHNATEAQAYVDGIFVPKTKTETVNGVEQTKTYYVFKNYSSHTMRIFYMERGAGASNLHMRFNLSYVTPGSVLMSKDIEGVSNVDYSLMKYPYQIYYMEDENEGYKRLKPNNQYGVYYLNPKKAADYYAQYKSLSNNQVYQDVFFLTPGKDVSISFPDDTQKYYIVECGLNSEVYEAIECNGQDFTGTSNNGGKDFTIVEATVKERPNIELVNKVDPNAIKTLTLRKKLVGQNGNVIDDDNTTFSFRLYLEKTDIINDGGFDVEEKKLELAYLHKYYVVSPDGKFCIWDSAQERFVASSVDYDANLADKTPYTFQTSPNGQISKIPVGYEVKVPDLLNGMKFQVEERESDNPIGYDVYALEGYTCLKEGEIFSYRPDNSKQNIGTVISAASPSMLITNKRGFGIEAKKVWTDADYTESHDPIYIAVYVDGVLKEGTVREINNDPTTQTQRYFFDDDDLYNGTKTLNDYHVYEVTAEKHVNPQTKEVTYSNVQRIPRTDGSEKISVNAIPTGGSPTAYNYTINYTEGAITGVADNARKDTITNIREGGVAIRLFDWGDKTHPLENGKFRITLTEGNAAPVEVGKGTYTTDQNGIAAILYSVSTTGTYTITETNAPSGYIGLPKSFTFTVTNVVTITHENVPGWVDHDTTDASGTYKGIIDIHNKQFNLKANKVDSATKAGLAGATFELYRGVISSNGKIIKDYFPISYYRCNNPECGSIPDDPFDKPKECTYCHGSTFVEETRLISGQNGEIPLITRHLPPDVYFLVEKKPPEKYTGIPVSVIFQIDELGNVAIGNDVKITKDGKDYTFNPKPDFVAAYAAQEDYLTQSGNDFTINIPNVRSVHDYYFNIEKLAFLDKNVHDTPTDLEQKFLFRVERLADDDTVLETLYVTIQCDTEKDSYPYTPLPAFSNHSYDPATKKVTVTCADGANYTFPAAIVSGTQCIEVSSTGIYRVTEVTSWSSTDYDFWKGSEKFIPKTGSQTTGEPNHAANDPFVTFRITDTDTDKTDCATVSFTNTETEYAYLSSQAYAENTIKRSGS